MKDSIKITIVSDLHGYYPELEGGDLLILCGDYTAHDELMQWSEFFSWLKNQNYERKVLIAGNHDGFLEECYPCNQEDITDLQQVREFLKENDEDFQEDFDYLCDSITEYEGLKIWGSPWTPTYGDWHFMKERGVEIKEKWDLIPNDIDILITHGPPHGILDFVDDENTGCEELQKALFRVKPKLHVFGHIHEGYGNVVLKRSGFGDENNTLCINASIMNENYKPVNKPINIEI